MSTRVLILIALIGAVIVTFLASVAFGAAPMPVRAAFTASVAVSEG